MAETLTDYAVDILTVVNYVSFGRNIKKKPFENKLVKLHAILLVHTVLQSIAKHLWTQLSFSSRTCLTYIQHRTSWGMQNVPKSLMGSQGKLHNGWMCNPRQMAVSELMYTPSSKWAFNPCHCFEWNESIFVTRLTTLSWSQYQSAIFSSDVREEWIISSIVTLNRQQSTIRKKLAGTKHGMKLQRVDEGCSLVRRKLRLKRRYYE